MSTDEDDSMWISTGWDEEKAYYVPILTIQGTPITLTKARATAYAQAAIAAAADAEHDAMIVKQLTERLSLDQDAAVAVMAKGRETRPPREASGFTWTGGVSLFSGQPFVSIHFKELALGQMDPASARRHGMHALEAQVGAENDTSYAYALKGTGLGWPEVTQVVAAAGEYRQEWSVADE
jgi:hypothetical protein